MASVTVVENLDVVEQAPVSVQPGFVMLEVNGLGFECVEKRFSDGVVITAEAMTLQELHVLLADELHESLTCVLAPAIGVEDDFSTRPVTRDRGAKRTADQKGINALSGRPTHHHTRFQIQDHSQVQPALARPDVGYITRPHLVDSLDVKASLKPIWAVLRPLPRPGRHPVSAANLCYNARALHEPFHPVAAAADAPCLQLHKDPRAAVDPVALFMHDADLVQESHIGYFPVPNDVLPEPVVTTPGCPEYLAHEHDRMLMRVLGDELVLPQGRRENTAIAFFLLLKVKWGDTICPPYYCGGCR